jgi:nitroreductase
MATTIRTPREEDGLRNPAPVDDSRLHPLIRERWSPRVFADRSVEPDVLRTLFEAARWAPSSYNDQPWSFIVARRDDPAAFEKLLGCLVEANRKWARDAPVLALSVARLEFRHNGKPNRHAYHDVGLATAQLVLQARALDVAVHQMAGFDVDKARETYRIPEGHDPLTAIALGYDPESLPEDVREKELKDRGRKPLEEVVFAGAWGTAAFSS